MFSFLVNKEVLKETKQELIKNLLEGDFLSFIEDFPIMKQKLQELKIEFAKIQGYEKTIYLEETDVSKKYMIFIRNKLVARFEFLREKNFTRKLVLSYYDNMIDASKMNYDSLKKGNYLEFRFIKPDITIFTFYKTFAWTLQVGTKKKIVERYKKDLLLTKEGYDRIGLCWRYYNLDGRIGEENVWFNKRVPDISRNRFEKQFKNALALTKEKQL